MTAETTAPNGPFSFNELIASLRNGLAVMLKLIMGGMVVVAAGILAVAVAMVGLILAAVAVGYRMVSGSPVAQGASPAAEGEGVILEARRTAHGWTVE